jgi:hypothetical protein
MMMIMQIPCHHNKFLPVSSSSSAKTLYSGSASSSSSASFVAGKERYLAVNTVVLPSLLLSQSLLDLYTLNRIRVQLAFTADIGHNIFIAVHFKHNHVKALQIRAISRREGITTSIITWY